MNDVKWGLFEVEEIFEVITGALIKKDVLEDGEIPRITATSLNNGVSLFTSELNHKNFRKFKNFISVSFLGDAFYQKTEVSLDMKIHGLKIKGKDLNEHLAKYLIPLIKKFSQKFAYGNQLSTSVLHRQKLTLPVMNDNSPDWEYMEQYVKNQEIESLEKTIRFLRGELVKIGTFSTADINTLYWREHKVNGLFDKIQRGKRLTKANQSPGNTPYVSSTAMNNGVDGHISENLPVPVRTFKDVIVIANSGSVGTTTYHPYRFVASDHVTALESKHSNEYIALFLVSSLSKIADKYAFNREINDARINNEKIMLPTTPAGEPDYEFMENYIKGLKRESITIALNFAEEKLKTLQ